MVRAKGARRDRKSTRLNSSHTLISYAVFCLKKKKKTPHHDGTSPLSHASVEEQTTPPVSCSLHASCHLRGPRLCYAPRLFVSFFFLMIRRPPRSPLFPSTTLSR